MPNARSSPSCVFHRPHEFHDEVRRNRGRFRRHVKPHLRQVLCQCATPWEPDRPPRRPQLQRTFWMRVHALALLDALAPLGAALEGTLATWWGDEYALHDAEAARYADAIELTLAKGDWPTAATTLRALGYRVSRASVGLDADGDFDVRVRAARGAAAALDATALRAKMAERYPPSVMAEHAPRAPG